MSESNSSSESLHKSNTKEEASSIQQQTDMPLFDFHRFLEQMKDPSAALVSRYTKGFISAFYRREVWTVNDQIKFIQDFLNFTFIRMRECDVWKDVSEKEFDNAKEGMEKLVMNRLYNATFSPNTMDDKEKDNILHHKISIFRWIREKHLDIPQTEDNESFLAFAESELLKMNNYKAPRDKLICILNCCKVIFGLIKHMNNEEGGADVFLPLLIYVVIRANPPRLISNVQYISRFRHPDHLRAEAGYYLTNLMGAIEFIESMDIKSLSISKEEFDANIEKTMNELEQEQSKQPVYKKAISYEDALHPWHAKRVQQPLGNIAQKSMSFVEKLFSDSESSYNRKEEEEPSPLSQQLPLPQIEEHQQRVLPARQIQEEEARKEFDEHLSTIVSMFPNIEPGVCFMILQATDGKLPETIESLLDMSNEQN
ncbi:hypothetical protein G6F43_011217 [Rhizopus delemar]|nr:hypothetical protein G6F43_011217 [Rhizopus delemar]